MDNQELAQEILKLTGPADNIISATSCMTRLRLVVKKEHFTKEELAKLPQINGVLKSGDEWHLVLGPGKATHVAAAFNNLLKQAEPVSTETKDSGTTAAGIPLSEPEPAVPPKNPTDFKTLVQNAEIGDGEALHAAIRQKNATYGKLLLKKIAHIFTPIIPAFIGCGLITGLLNIFIKLNPDLAALPVLKLLGVAGNAVFWSLNILVGVNAAREFGGSPMLGGVMAAVITHPALSGITIFGDKLVPGRGGIIAVLLVVLFASFLEQKLHKIIPETMDLFITPLLVVIISTFVATGICQPVGSWLSNLIGGAATGAIKQGGALTGFILGGAWLPMVMLGIHQGMTPIHADLLATYGTNILLPILAMAGCGQVGATLAVYVKTKNSQLRKTIASALPVGIMGIGEPLIYGVTLPLGKPFLGACLGGACGGALQASFAVGATTMGLSGLPLAASTNPVSIYLLGVITAYVSGFIATWIIGFDDPPKE